MICYSYRRETEEHPRGSISRPADQPQVHFQARRSALSTPRNVLHVGLRWHGRLGAQLRWRYKFKCTACTAHRDVLDVGFSWDGRLGARDEAHVVRGRSGRDRLGNVGGEGHAVGGRGPRPGVAHLQNKTKISIVSSVYLAFYIGVHRGSPLRSFDSSFVDVDRVQVLPTCKTKEMFFFLVSRGITQRTGIA